MSWPQGFIVQPVWGAGHAQLWRAETVAFAFF